MDPVGLLGCYFSSTTAEVMRSFIIKSSQFIILATASIGISILLSFVMKINFHKLEPKSSVADWNEIRYHVAIMYNHKYECSGTLIGERNVITLATCLKIYLDTSFDYKTFMKVTIGTRTLPGGILFDVEKVTLHPDYEYSSRKDDIAHILLKEKVTTGPTQKPISYLPKKSAKKGLEMLVSGYGESVFSHGTLHKFNMKIVDSERCRKLAAKEKTSSGKYLDMSRKFCAIAEHGSNHPRISYGSPATVNQEYIVGFYLGHIKQGNKPGIFVNVSDYITFINNQIT